MNLKKSIIIFCTLLSIIILTSGGIKEKNNPDKTISETTPYKYRSEGKDKEIKTTSFYLTMRDGEQIAVSLHLPSDLKKEIQAKIAAYSSPIDFYAIHPGGHKILQACEKALGIQKIQNHFFTFETA